jgi:hypothetical protein
MFEGRIAVCLKASLAPQAPESDIFEGTKAGHNTELKHALALAKACHSTEEKRVTGVLGSSDALGKTVSSAALRDTGTLRRTHSDVVLELGAAVGIDPPPRSRAFRVGSGLAGGGGMAELIDLSDLTESSTFHVESGRIGDWGGVIGGGGGGEGMGVGPQSHGSDGLGDWGRAAASVGVGEIGGRLSGQTLGLVGGVGNSHVLGGEKVVEVLLPPHPHPELIHGIPPTKPLQQGVVSGAGGWGGVRNSQEFESPCSTSMTGTTPAPNICQDQVIGEIKGEARGGAEEGGGQDRMTDADLEALENELGMLAGAGKT